MITQKYIFKKFKNISVLFLILFLLSLNLFAVEITPIVKRYDLNSTPSLDQSIINQEFIIENTNYLEDNLHSYVNQNILIKFGFDGLPEDQYLSGFSTRIVLKITPIKNDGSLDDSINKTLNIKYETSLNSTNFIDFSALNIENVKGAKVKITSFNFIFNSQSYFTNPGNTYLELKYTSDYFCTNGRNSAPTGLTANFQNNNGEIEFSWNNPSNECTEEYELEWTWIDNVDNIDHDFSVRDFELNSTRIRLKREFNFNQDIDQTYKISNIYKEGNILYRVRKISRWLEKKEKNFYGEWTTIDSPSIIKVSDWSDKLPITSSHQDNKNWQYQSSYAENGKKKEVVSYFDGTLRNRQTVTKINSQNNIVVGEVIYDNQGRPAIEILPVPTNETIISYIPDFNLNEDGNIFTHYDFDWDTDPNVCGTISNKMSTNIGASQYYSNQSLSATNTWQDNVPDAEGYPYSQIEYSSDNTGRILRKSGVGINHQLGSDHEMKYIYSTPKQSELNRLFGYNVGDNLHYKKNIVVDPNEQVSISYIDPQGRTIATALAGDSPNNINEEDVLLGLDDEKGDSNSRVQHTILQQDALQTNNSIYSDGYYNGIKSYEIITPVSNNTEYTFNYALNTTSNIFTPEIPSTATGTCDDDTFPFKYDLKISLLDECGEEKLENAPSLTNESQLATTPTPMLVTLNVEAYTLSKDIKINKQQLDIYADQFIENFTDPDSNCYIDPDQFSPQANFESCATSCEGCALELVQLYYTTSVLDNYDSVTDAIKLEAQNNYIACHTNGSTLEGLLFSQNNDGENFFIPGYDNLENDIKTLYETRFSIEFNLLLDSCFEPCETGVFDNTCTVSKFFLLNDMTLGGQYADDTLTDTDGDNVPDSVVNLSSVFDERRSGYASNYAPNPSNYQSFTKIWRDVTYYDENGVEEKVYLETINDNYTPEVLSGVTILTDALGDYIKVTQLKNISDFFDRWKDIWAEDLLYLHPEHGYLQYQEELCSREVEILSLQDEFSSMSYNSYLKSIETFEEASHLGLANILSIYNNDPYFIIEDYDFETGTDVSTSAYRKNIMLEAITSNYSGSTKKMFEMVYEFSFQEDMPSNILDGNEIIQGNLSETQQNLLWNQYRDTYLAFKQKLSNFFMHLYAKKNGFYNECIGRDVSGIPDFSNTEFFNDYTEGHNLSIYFMNNSDAILPSFCSTIANNLDLGYFYTKEKRFTDLSRNLDNSATDAENMASYTESTDYAMLLQTGRCPLSFDLETFLRTFFSSINQTEIIDFSNFSQNNFENLMHHDLLNAIVNESTPYSTTYKFNTDNINSELNIYLNNFNPTLTNTQYNVTENLIVTGYDWSDYNPSIETAGNTGDWKISNVNNLFYINNYVDDVNGVTYYNYTIQADLLVKSANGTLVFVESEISGVTTAKIGECNNDFDDQAVVDGQNTSELLPGGNSTITTTITSEEKYILFKNLITHLINRLGIINEYNIVNDQDLISIPDGYNCVELELLAPYMSIENPRIYHFKPDELAIDCSGYMDNGNYLQNFNFLASLTQPSNFELQEISFSFIPNPSPVNIQNCNIPNDLSICYPGLYSDGFNVSIHQWRVNNDINGHVNFCEGFTALELNASKNGRAIVKGVNFEVETNDITCIPSQILPINCEEKYNIYLAFLDLKNEPDERVSETIINYTLPTELWAHGLDEFDANGDPNPNYRDDVLDYFCNSKLGYFVSPYINYINNLNIDTTYDINYISLEQFSNTKLGLDYDLMNIVVSLYNTYNSQNLPISAYPDRMFWNAFANDYMETTFAECSPIPNINYGWNENMIDNPPVMNCYEFLLEVQENYSSEAYDSFLNSLKEKFKRDYTTAALNNISETFTYDYFDKEYQYTLYYYDQAGNLIQTVPPEGVDRKDDIDNDAVNTYRINPTGTAPAIPNHRLKTQYKYNSLNQLVWQKTPDGGVTVFAYDKLGRIVASQNDKQKNLVSTIDHDLTQAFSYTLYDGLGRITEAGQVYLKPYYSIDNGKFLYYSEEKELPQEICNGYRTEVSKTEYDEFSNSNIEILFNEYGNPYSYNSRGRVVEVKYYDNLSCNKRYQPHNNAIYYDYDIHGNVKQILREINDDSFLKEHKQHIKSTIYEYDLISGNVNKVYYQKHKRDQFIHKYQYDADNRITNVQTSKDGVIWEKDAEYNYYDHGPLARTVLGEHQVQGIDYAYTLQGWLKSVNGDRLNPANDMGKDGLNQTNVAKDAFAYALHYYQDDYKDRVTGSNPFLAVDTNSNQYNLYNGNIKSMVTSILNEQSNPIKTANNSYRYDQLNRIKSMNSTEIDDFGIETNGISSNYSFDRNGNLKTLNRLARNKAGTISLMDSFTYQYNKDTNGNIINNQLQLVNDMPFISLFADRFETDIDDQQNQLAAAGINYNPSSSINPDGTINETARATHNYQYDKIGQLVADLTEGLARIEWTVSGKVKRIFKVKPDYLIANQQQIEVFVNEFIGTNGSNTNNNFNNSLVSIINFDYDALGNRLSKKVKDYIDKYHTAITTYYIRDAQGNVLSIYKKEEKDRTKPNLKLTKPNLKLEEQNIYGSSRVGLTKNNLFLVSPYSSIIGIGEKKEETLSELAVDRAMNFNANYEATINENPLFNFKNKEALSIGIDIEINIPDINGVYNITKFESQNQDSIVKQHQLKLDLLFNGEQYKPQLSLRTFKDSTNIKNVVFTFDKNLKDKNLNLSFDVQILDEENDKYDVILTLGKENYMVGKGLNQTITYEPYTTSHTTPISKIASNLDNPLDFSMDNFYYSINGTKRAYHFEKGYGNPVSTDGQKSLAVSTGSWLTRGVRTRHYQRIIGDKRYELSNHLGNVLSVISDHKVINTDTGTSTHITPFVPGTDIAPWYAHSLTDNVEQTDRGLLVETTHNLNGIGAEYTLEANTTYIFAFYMNNMVEGFDVEFGISYDDRKVFTKFIEYGEQHYQFEFTTDQAGIYTLNLNVRAKEEEFKLQSFYVQKFEIREISDNDGTITANNFIFVPEVLSYNDYYPFGMLVPNRNYSSPSYRYGFQGQEKDDEVKGSGNSLNYKYRMHDPRLGKFLSLDPLAKKYPWNSPYAFSENRVIDGVELEGLEFYHFSVRFLTDNQGTIRQTMVHSDYVQDYVDWKMPSWDASKEYDIRGKYPAPKSYILNVKGSNFIFPTYKDLVTSVGDGSWKNLTPENHPTLEGIEDKVKSLYNKTDALGGVLNFGVGIRGFFRNIGKKKVPATNSAAKISAIDIDRNIVGKKIDPNTQGKHLTNSNQYKVNVNDNNVHKSVLTEDAQALLDGFHKGDFDVLNIREGGRTIKVDFGKPIGDLIEKGTGKNLGSTNYGAIKYGKNKVHITPVKN